MNDVSTIFFDFMGTCLDWHSSIVEAFPHRIETHERSRLAIAWREAFFKDIHSRFEQKLPPEDIDITHARLLDSLTEGTEFVGFGLSEVEEQAAVRAWHRMTAWPDVSEALSRLRQKYEVFVLANGTTRLQLDLAKSSGLEFDMLFSSQLLGLTKPDPKTYITAMRLVGATPASSAMVAAHVYDLRAAKKVGMTTVYIRRWTEDTEEDMNDVQRDVDIFFGTVDKSDGQLSDLGDMLC